MGKLPWVLHYLWKAGEIVHLHYCEQITYHLRFNLFKIPLQPPIFLCKLCTENKPHTPLPRSSGHWLEPKSSSCWCDRRLTFLVTFPLQFSVKLIGLKWNWAQHWQKYNHEINSIYGEGLTATWQSLQKREEWMRSRPNSKQQISLKNQQTRLLISLSFHNKIFIINYFV